jgi:hypothetical protein
MYMMDTGIKVPAGMPVYADGNYTIAITSTFRSFRCGGSDKIYAKCATVMWHVRQGVSHAVASHSGSRGEFWDIGTGPYICYIRTDGFRNTVAFEGRYWQIDCGYYVDTTYWPRPWKSLGVIKLVFNSNYTVSVYKDGQHLYNVPVYVCGGPPEICGRGPWAPAQRLVIPVFWGPDDIALSVVQFRYDPNSMGYGTGLIYMHGTQTAAAPFYYRCNLTGAYPYRLEVKIDTAEKNITTTNNVNVTGGWIYINVTYSGYLKLYLGDQLVAYDALYGWTIRRVYVPPPPIEYEPGEPDSTCVPQKVRTPKGLEHRNLQQGENSYSVEVVKKYEVREFGCGVDRKYTETVSAGVYTATTTSYHVKDPNNKVCGFKQAQNCGGTVYCGSC